MEKQKKGKFKVDLVQPNKVTMAKYDYTACQENVLTCIVKAIQDHMTQKKPIQTDLFGNPEITVKASEIAKGNTKSYVVTQVKKLMHKHIEFEWTNSETGRDEEVTTSLVNTIRDEINTDLIHLEISKWVIPYLVYWGKGVGGTIFNGSIALTLKSIYSKRIYKLLKQWEDKGGVPPMELSKFREMMGIEKKYPRPSDIQKRVLEPAKKELNEFGDITFEYSFSKIKSRSYNTLNIKIFGNKRKSKESPIEWYKYVYTFLCLVFPNHESDKALTATDKIEQDGKLKVAFDLFGRLDDQYSSGKIESTTHLKNIVKKVLKEDFQIF